MAHLRKNGRRCKFESLENRRMLAGDVSVKLIGSSLFVQGDFQDNGVTFTNGGLPNQIVVAGVNAGGSPTGINGTPNGSVTLNNFANKLSVKLGLGNDSVAMNNLTVKGTLKVSTGKGIDTVTVTNTTANGNAKIKLGGGSDTLTVATSVIKGATKIKAGVGNDIVGINNSTFRILNTQLGRGNDTLSIAGTTAGKTILNGGKGVNTVTYGLNNTLFNLTQKKFV